MGITILLVEQNVRQALDIADHAYLLEAGRPVESGAAADSLESERVVETYLGGSGKETSGMESAGASAQ